MEETDSKTPLCCLESIGYIDRESPGDSGLLQALEQDRAPDRRRGFPRPSATTAAPPLRCHRRTFLKSPAWAGLLSVRVTPNA